jgi:hypothetical protein
MVSSCINDEASIVRDHHTVEWQRLYGGLAWQGMREWHGMAVGIVNGMAWQSV